jgi:pimeloyl-ACP methyl ester carboxylesterase
MNFVQMADGVRLYVEDFGEGQPIVLICGANLTHQSWESQVAALAGEFRTISFDWRGTGASDKPRGGYTGEAAAGDVLALIDRLGLAPAVLIGHGLGAHLALLAAYAAPQKVKGLVLTAAAPWFSGERDGMAGGAPGPLVPPVPCPPVAVLRRTPRGGTWGRRRRQVTSRCVSITL